MDGELRRVFVRRFSVVLGSALAAVAFLPAIASAGTCETTTANCNVRASDFSAVEGNTFTGEIAKAKDFSNFGITETVGIDWGDGSTSNVPVPKNGGNGVYVPVTASHKYADEGTHTTKVSLFARKADGTCPTMGCRFDGARGTATVNDAPLTASGVDRTSDTRTYSGIVATFTDGNPDAPASDFSAVIDWGDGSTSAGSIGAGGSGFFVGGSHTYAIGGPHTVTTAIADKGGSTASATSHITVARNDTTLVADPAILIITPLELRLGNLQAHLKIAGTNTPIAGRIIEFSAGGTFICADDTDDTGTAHCDGLLPGGVAAILNLGYTATFKGDPQFKPQTAHGTLIGPGGPI
jgi:hypothetical protein